MLGEIISTLIAFVVIVFVIYRYVWPLLSKMVKDRQALIQQQVDDAAEAERLNAEAQQRYDSAVADARNEAGRMRDDARADATRIKEELVEQAKAEVERLKQRGQDQLVAERDLTARRLRSEVGGQSMQLAERIVVDSLKDDSSRSESVDSFLSDLGGLPVRGGQAVTTGGTTGGRS
jgi:F-type H+-transporting ATPase subunit b